MQRPRSFGVLVGFALIACGCTKSAPSRTTETQVAMSASSVAPKTTASSAQPAQLAPVDPAALASTPLHTMIKPASAEDAPLADKKRGALAVGMRVRIIKRDRALKPEETGHTASLALGPGQRGVVERFIERRLSGYTFVVAVVRWDAQLWYEWDIALNRMKQGVAYGANEINEMNATDGPAIALGPIETTAHPETLEEAK